jgi:hypothetical protein
MNTSGALTAVFAYRLVNFCMILVGGGIAMVILTRAREHRIRRYPSPGRPVRHYRAGARGKPALGSGRTPPPVVVKVREGAWQVLAPAQAGATIRA